MREAINEALKVAVKAQDRRRMSTLRLINAAIKDRDIAARGAGKDKVTDAEVLDILSKMVKQRRESIETHKQGNRPDLVKQEQEEIDIIQSFLPRQLDDAETRSAVSEAMEELGCEGLKDMGKVMGLLKERYAGRMDFARAGQTVKELLKERGC